MSRRPVLVLTIAAFAVGSMLTALGGRERDERSAEQADRTLRVLARNPRYFTDGSGRAVYLTGSHVWENLVESHVTDSDVTCRRSPSGPFDYAAYLDRLVGYHHNFMRLWRWELSRWGNCGVYFRVGPQPWRRTGPGRALDGGLRFDLAKLDPAYFRRLRARVAAAGSRGIYVSVMLFEGWGLQLARDGWAWKGHPFNRRNNVNRIDGDVDRNGVGTEVNTLKNRAVTRIQEAYVRRVVRAVAGLHNVLYEISNESGGYSTAWQRHMIRVVRRAEAARGRRPPVGMTYQYIGGNNATLRASGADWVSPGGLEYLLDPPAADGTKVSISDTDHHTCGWRCQDTARFAWRSLLRGHNPILMDPWDDDPGREAARLAMGDARRYAERIDLGSAVPRGALASTGYCLANPGTEYLVFQPDSGSFTLDLTGAPGPFEAEWFLLDGRRAVPAEPVAGSAVVTLEPPGAGPAVLLLRRT